MNRNSSSGLVNHRPCCNAGFLHRRSLCERVSKGGGFHTESSVPKSTQAGVGDFKQTDVRGPQIQGWGIGVKENNIYSIVGQGHDVMYR